MALRLPEEPTENEINELVRAVQPKLAQSIRSYSSHRRRLKMLGGGAVILALFGSGVAVGGAASLRTIVAASDLTLNCYLGKDAPVSGGTIPADGRAVDEANPALAAARADPSASCADQFSSGAAYDAAYDQIAKHIEDGALCGYVRFADGTDWGFQADVPGDPRWGLWTRSPAPGSLGTDCILLTVNAVEDHAFDAALACAVSDTEVRVYAASSGVAACAEEGLGPWLP